ncbi:MAG: ABC transporter ATP-binding protein [Balneola sp.]
MISLSVTGLTKKYNRKTVFEDVQFGHNSGILGISGSNGSGKSTLMKCLAGLLRPNSGTIEWKLNGDSLSQQELKNHIGYAAPYISLYEELTVLENLEFLSEVSHQHLDETDIQQLLSKTETDSLKDKLYKSISTGQQQRVKLASSLIRDPEVLFWDEPGSNLDSNGHALVQRLLEEQKEKGCLVFLASNDPDEIALCDEVLELSI